MPPPPCPFGAKKCGPNGVPWIRGPWAGGGRAYRPLPTPLSCSRGRAPKGDKTCHLLIFDQNYGQLRGLKKILLQTNLTSLLFVCGGGGGGVVLVYHNQILSRVYSLFPRSAVEANQKPFYFYFLWIKTIKYVKTSRASFFMPFKFKFL